MASISSIFLVIDPMTLCTVEVVSSPRGRPSRVIPVRPIRHASARPSEFLSAKRAALPGQRRTAADRAASFAPLLTGDPDQPFPLRRRQEIVRPSLIHAETIAVLARGFEGRRHSVRLHSHRGDGASGLFSLGPTPGNSGTKETKETSCQVLPADPAKSELRR